MSVKKRGLGRGLDALLGANTKLESNSEKVRTLPIDQLMPGDHQPRKAFDQTRLQELADSISAQGIVQPVVVRETTEGHYELIAGERRWRAAQLAGLTEVPVIVRKVSNQEALAIALIENIQREDLNALEEAEALKRLLDEYELTHQQLADAVGKSRTSVSNLLRLNELQAQVKPLLVSGEIEMGHARALLGLDGELQLQAANQIVARQLTVRDVEAMVQSLRESAPKRADKRDDRDPDIRRLEDDISARLGAPVAIRHGNKGSGKIVIRYNSLDELDGVLNRLRTRELGY